MEKEKEIVNAAGQNPELFGELVMKVDLKKISVDKAFHEMQKKIKKPTIGIEIDHDKLEIAKARIGKISDIRDQ